MTTIGENAFVGCPPDLCIICDDPDSIRRMANHVERVINYHEYMSSRYDELKGENLTTEEAKGLYNLLESEKLKSGEISLQDICSIFPSKSIDES